MTDELDEITALRNRILECKNINDARIAATTAWLRAQKKINNTPEYMANTMGDIQ